MKKLRKLSRQNPWSLAGTVLIVAAVGTALILGSRAASPYVSNEVETGTLSGASRVAATDASGGAYAQFGTIPGGGGGGGGGGDGGGTGGIGGGANMMVSLDIGSWGQGGYDDAAQAVKYVRVASDRGADNYRYARNSGLKVLIVFPGDLNIGGDYNTGGVKAINADGWANQALSFYQSNCTTDACPVLEVLNEPDGDWFWGSGANSSANQQAYANLLKVVYNKFHGAYGSAAPKIIANFETSWGDGWWNSGMTPYVDGVVVHPYGGASGGSGGANGDRQEVQHAHDYTGKPVYITEVGWPTAVGQPSTGDSQQWSESAQATNIYNFISWARGTGYVYDVTIFSYRDYGTNMWYGVEKENGTRKPSFNALKCASQSLPQNC